MVTEFAGSAVVPDLFQVWPVFTVYPEFEIWYQSTRFGFQPGNRTVSAFERALRFVSITDRNRFDFTAKLWIAGSEELVLASPP
jgi:hypothetical protein